MNNKRLVLFILLCGIAFSGCPDPAGSEDNTDEMAFDASVYESLKGGWVVRNHVNGFLDDIWYIVFTDEQTIEYYCDDFNSLTRTSDILTLDNGSIGFESSTGSDYTRTYYFTDAGELYLCKEGDENGRAVKAEKISDSSQFDNRKGLCVVLNDIKNGTAGIISSSFIEGDVILPVPSDVDVSDLIIDFYVPQGCSVTPDDSGNSLDFSSDKIYTVTGADGVSSNYTVSVVQPDKSVNLLVDGDFSDNGKFWWGSSDTLSNQEYNLWNFDNEEAHITVAESSTDKWRVSIGDSPDYLYTLENGKTYEVSFKAKANKERGIVQIIHESGRDLNSDGNLYSAYVYNEAQLTTEYSSFTYRFTMNNPTDDNPSFKFFLAQDTGEVWIDDVVLKEYVAPPQTFSATGSLRGDVVSIDTSNATVDINSNGIGPLTGPWIEFNDSEGTRFMLLQEKITGIGTFYFDASEAYFIQNPDTGNWCSVEVTITEHNADQTVGTYSLVNRDDSNDIITGAFSVNLPPHIISANPVNNATGVATNITEVTFTFSEPMRSNYTFNHCFSDTLLGAIEWSTDGRTLILNIESTLDSSTTYTTVMNAGEHMVTQTGESFPVNLIYTFITAP